MHPRPRSPQPFARNCLARLLQFCLVAGRPRARTTRAQAGQRTRLRSSSPGPTQADVKTLTVAPTRSPTHDARACRELVTLPCPLRSATDVGCAFIGVPAIAGAQGLHVGDACRRGLWLGVCPLPPARAEPASPAASFFHARGRSMLQKRQRHSGGQGVYEQAPRVWPVAIGYTLLPRRRRSSRSQAQPAPTSRGSMEGRAASHTPRQSDTSFQQQRPARPPVALAQAEAATRRAPLPRGTNSRPGDAAPTPHRLQ
jgi:hypothetical protein